MFLRTDLVSKEEFWPAYRKLGAIYFIRDSTADQIKIGYSTDPWRRLIELQIGNGHDLELIGVIAARQEIEPLIHRELMVGAVRGEWFWDWGVTTEWLMDMTQDEPMCRNVWRLVPSQRVIWDGTVDPPTKHLFNRETGKWEPPLK